ncbi:MAG: YdcF family protein [Alphaproteobacteria bacterium]
MESESILRDVAYQLMPPDILLLLMAVVLPFCLFPRGRVWFARLGLLLLIMSIPVVANLASLPLRLTEVDTERLTGSDYDAIVVLGGGVYVDNQGGYWLTRQSARRGAAGKALAVALELPVILSGGGPVPDQPPEAEVLASQYDFPDMAILETRSLNTYENAVNTAEILRQNDWSRILLVTSDTHLLRAVAMFRSQGVETVGPVGVDEPMDTDGSDFIPSVSAFSIWRKILKEYTGIAWYLMTGRIGLDDLGSA